MRNLLLLKKDRPGRRAKLRRAGVKFSRLMAVLSFIAFWGAWGKYELGIWPFWIPAVIDIGCIVCGLFFIWLGVELER